jgi:FlaA1/EpsC-like NDP-sugar epimerase
MPERRVCLRFNKGNFRVTFDRAAIVSATANQPIRNRYLFAADLFLIAIAAAIAYALRFDWLFALYRDEFPLFLACALVVKPVTFFLFGLYRRYWRYASMWDLIAVVFASSAAALVMAAIMVGLLLFDVIIELPRTVIPIDWLLTTMLIGGVRMSVRVLAEAQGTPSMTGPDSGAKRVLVVGAGNAGVMVVREMQRNPHLGLVAVGFLDDDPVKQGKTILGVKVLGRLEAVAKCATESGAQEVIIALPTAPGTVVRGIAERCREVALTTRVIPGVFELLDGKVSVNRLRSVEISDLLRRAQVPIDALPRDYIRGRTVLVTGAGGSIGSELCRQVARDQPRKLIVLGHGENSIFDVQHHLKDAYPALEIVPVIADVRNRARLDQVFAQVRPEVVFHAAAHKHVPLMEDNPQEAITNNVFGTRNIVDCAVAFDVDRLVMISTDKAVAPMNLMGASKRLAEIIVRRAAESRSRRFAVVRFGNVLGSRGSVVPLFKAQIERGGPLTVTHPEMRRFFMTIPEAVHLVLEAGGQAKGGELFVLNMGEPVRIVDLARDLIELSGLGRDDIPITFSGLRSGEKLDERLWEEGAAVTPTSTPDVFRVVEADRSETVTLDAGLQLLEGAVTRGTSLAIQHSLAQLIPTYSPAPEGRPRSAELFPDA